MTNTTHTMNGKGEGPTARELWDFITGAPLEATILILANGVDWSVSWMDASPPPGTFMHFQLDPPTLIIHALCRMTSGYATAVVSDVTCPACLALLKEME